MAKNTDKSEFVAADTASVQTSIVATQAESTDQADVDTKELADRQNVQRPSIRCFVGTADRTEAEARAYEKAVVDLGGTATRLVDGVMIDQFDIDFYLTPPKPRGAAVNSYCVIVRAVPPMNSQSDRRAL